MGIPPVVYCDKGCHHTKLFEYRLKAFNRRIQFYHHLSFISSCIQIQKVLLKLELKNLTQQLVDENAIFWMRLVFTTIIILI